MNKEAMKLAIKLIKTAQNNLAPSKHSAHVYGDGELWDEYADAIKALEEALAKQEQGEPVAWEVFALKFANGTRLQYGKPENLPKYLGCRPLYTTPQQRTWVGLTWHDVPNEWVGNVSFMEGAKWAEAKLKEKNG